MRLQAPLPAAEVRTHLRRDTKRKQARRLSTESYVRTIEVRAAEALHGSLHNLMKNKNKSMITTAIKVPITAWSIATHIE